MGKGWGENNAQVPFPFPRIYQSFPPDGIVGEGSWKENNAQDPSPLSLPIPSAAKYLMRRGWVHTRPKYFMRVEPCVRYPPRHAKRDERGGMKWGPLLVGHSGCGAAQITYAYHTHHPLRG